MQCSGHFFVFIVKWVVLGVVLMHKSLNVLHVAGGLPSDKNPSFQPFIASQINSLKTEGVNIEVLDLSQRYESGIHKYVNGFFDIKKMINKYDYDLIHSHYSYCGIISRLNNRIPVVLSLMGSDLLGSPDPEGRQTFKGRFDTSISKIISRYVSHVIVKSEDMAEHLPGGISYSVLPNGVDFKLFKQIDRHYARKYFNLDLDEKIIIFAANPGTTRKNFQLAEQAVRLLQHKNGYRVRLWPFFGKKQEELSLAMNAADALIMTSFWEGSPNVIKEAMACNLPVVSVDVGDVSKVILNAKQCHVSKYCPDELSLYIEKIIESGERSNGRECIAHLKLENIAKKLVDIYYQVLDI